MAADDPNNSPNSQYSSFGSIFSSLSPSPKSSSKSLKKLKIRNLSEWVSLNIANTMARSECGLSVFSYPLNRLQADIVCTQLTDLNLKIIAIWVVARPLGNNVNTRFDHWCVKIQAEGALISLDWLECKKKGYIKFEQTVASNVELKDFLHYYYTDPNIGRQTAKWKIIASITPSPLFNTSYLNTLDDHDLNTLQLYINSVTDNNNKNKRVKPKLLKAINCPKRVNDIAGFIEMWTYDTFTKKTKRNANNKYKGTPYSAIIRNCQHFAADLFGWLVGNQYPNKVRKLYNMMDVKKKKKMYNNDDNKIDNY